MVCVTYDGLAPFEFSVAYEVFGKPGDYLPKPWYRFVVCAPRPGPVMLSSGLSLDIPLGLRALARADTVIVPPSRFPDSVPEDVLTAIRRAHRRGARIVSLCTGAFVVAAAGLLDGRRATTHWMFTDELASRYPAIIVDPAVLYVDEGDVLTSAGVASCIDMCLHVVRHDWGAEVANNLSRYMVVPSHRNGGQAQFISAPMLTTTPSNQPLGATLDWARERLAQEISIESLAARAAMSPRSFARHFRAQIGTTPHRWLTHERVDFARRLLETTDLPVEVVAERSGLGTGANLRQRFREDVRTTPNAYRKSFRELRG